MKLPLKKKQKTKTVKPSVLGSYTASYLDKRSKSYHKVVMPAFVGLFGLVGAAYIFGSSAAPESGADQAVNNGFIAQNGPLIVRYFAVLLIVGILLYVQLKRK